MDNGKPGDQRIELVICEERDVFQGATSRGPALALNTNAGKIGIHVDAADSLRRACDALSCTSAELRAAAVAMCPAADGWDWSKSEGETMEICVTMPTGNILDGDLGIPTAQVDGRATQRKYAELVESALEAEFPNHTIRVDAQIDTSGGRTDISVDGETGAYEHRDIEDRVREVLGEVFQSDGWVVATAGR